MSTKHMLSSSFFFFVCSMFKVSLLVLEVKTLIRKNNASSCLVKLVNWFWSFLSIKTHNHLIHECETKHGQRRISLWKPKAKAKPKKKCPLQLIRFLYFIWLFQSQRHFSNFTIVGYGPQLQTMGFILLISLIQFMVFMYGLSFNSNRCPSTSRNHSLYKLCSVNSKEIES